MRYFFHIAYHGTNYSGWQKHSGVVTVQQIIEESLSRLFKLKVNITGCGRTDAQVHASQFFFHCDLNEGWDFDLLFRLNKILPDDIAVFDILPVDGLPHARFDAFERTYNYYIHLHKDPFLNCYSAFYPCSALDLNSMTRAIALLPNYKDYHAFCKCPKRVEHTICNVSSATLYVSEDEGRLRFEITANRFLSKMVRIITGRLLEIGRGIMSVDEFEHYLKEKETPKIIVPAYPQGLYLSKVTYPYLNIPVKSIFSSMLNENLSRKWLAV